MIDVAALLLRDNPEYVLLCVVRACEQFTESSDEATWSERRQESQQPGGLVQAAW